MSTILKALRRLETERTRPDRSLRDEVLGDGERPSGPRKSRALPLTLLVGLVLIVGGGLAAVAPLFFSGDASQPAGSAAPAAGTAPSSAPVARALRPPPAPPAAIPAPASSASPPSVPAPHPAPPPVATRSPSARVTRVEPAPTSLAPPAPPAARPRPAPDARPASPPAPAAKRHEAAVARVEPAPVPDVQVLRTRWHPDPGRRVAVVTMSGRAGELDLHEGDAVGSLVVVRIDPSGVLFRNGNVEITRRVGAR